MPLNTWNQTTAINNWEVELERVLANADTEIRLLQDAKDNCDHALAQKAIPESVNAECLGNEH